MQLNQTLVSSPLAAPKTLLRSLLQAAKGTTAFITLLFDESGNLQPVWDLGDSLVDSSAYQLAIASMKTNPAIAALLEERYLAPPHDLDALLHYPKDSLGQVYASHMRQAGFQPLQPAIAIHSDTHYVDCRFQQTHDIWHVITGFDTSEVGEIGLQAFYLAQFQLPLASLLVANALIAATVLQPENLNPLLSAIAQGWQMGKTAKPLIAEKWEEAWEKPISQWQTDLNLQPVSNQ